MNRLRLALRPELGCLILALVVLTICLLPIFFVNLMHQALAKLHLAGPVCVLVVLGIFIGGFINLPIHRMERNVVQQPPRGMMDQLMGWLPMRPAPTQTVIAVNVGGCLIPLGLAVYESLYVLTQSQATGVLAVMIVGNTLLCYFIARPVAGVGIMMPALTSPICCVIAARLLLMSAEFDDVRAPVAFIAGVLGPLIGADLLHLRDITRVSAGMLSIGGAGKFDGIVLSGLLAALLA